MAVSTYVLRPEESPVIGFNDLYHSQEAQAYPLNSERRALWAATMHNQQLRVLFLEMVERCQWWAGYFDFVLVTCQAILCHNLKDSHQLQSLLVQLVASAMLLRPFLADMQLPLPALCRQYGIVPGDIMLLKLWKCIREDMASLMALTDATVSQNGTLIVYTEQQQSFVRNMRQLCSTRSVAGLLQALVAQHNLTDQLPDETIVTTLRQLLAGVRVHGCLGVLTTIPAENAGQAAGPAEPLDMAPSATGTSSAASPVQLATTDVIDVIVGDGLDVAKLDTLDHLNGFAQPTQIPGDLVMWSNAQLSSIEGLGPETTLFDRLWVDADPMLTTLMGLQSLQSVCGDGILCNSGMTSLNGVNSLQVVEEDLGVSSLSLATTRQLSYLTTVGSPVKLLTNELIAQDKLVSGLSGSSAALTWQEPVTVRSHGQGGRIGMSEGKRQLLKFLRTMDYNKVISIQQLQPALLGGDRRSNDSDDEKPSVNVKRRDFPKLMDVPALGPVGRLLNAGVWHNELTDVRHDCEALTTGKRHGVQPGSGTLPGRNMKIITSDNFSGSDKQHDKPISHNTSRWRRVFCVRLGKTIAATGVAVASVLLRRRLGR